MTAPHPAREAALAYAAHGWPVFPVAPRAKRPLTEHGKDDASADRERVVKWWKRWPDAGVAIATGQVSGLAVVDVDPRNGGDDGIEDLEAKHGRLPDSPVVLTGAGGTHSYFGHPGGEVPCRSNLGGFRGVDLKGDGGYVVAPPSIHPSGIAYTWNPWLDLEMEIPPFPPVLVDLARKGPAQRPARRYADGFNAAAEAFTTYDPRVRERFERSTAGLADTTPSGVDYSLACMLARRGADGGTIERLVRESRALAGLPEKRPSYFRSTVGKALALAAEGA